MCCWIRTNIRSALRTCNTGSRPGQIARRISYFARRRTGSWGSESAVTRSLSMTRTSSLSRAESIWHGISNSKREVCMESFRLGHTHSLLFELSHLEGLLFLSHLKVNHVIHALLCVHAPRRFCQNVSTGIHFTSRMMSSLTLLRRCAHVEMSMCIMCCVS